MVWMGLALLALAVLIGLVVPLFARPDAKCATRIDYDMVVYRDQLAEIDQEIERGVLTKAQGDSARLEIHRRMLAAEDAELTARSRPSERSHRAWRIGTGIAVVLLVTAGSSAMYALLGSPGLSGKPYGWRIKHDSEFQYASEADRLKAQVQASPSISGYKNLAKMYFGSRNYAQAADADRHVIELGANDAASWSEYGEALVMANGGAVVPQAMTAFAKSLAADPRSERSRFYIGLAESQIGNLKRAVGIWKDLEQSSDPGAAWLPMVREHITAFSKQGGFDPTSVRAGPPDPAVMNSAMSAMATALQAKDSGSQTSAPAGSADAQETMIHGMVDKLAAEMQKNPGNAAGWSRLAHAYNVLGQTDKARDAIDRAVRLHPRDTDILLTLAETQKASAPENVAPPDYAATMRQVLKIDPANAAALYAVGVEEKRAGHADRARVMWKQALGKLSPDDPLAEQIHGQLGTSAPKTAAP